MLAIPLMRGPQCDAERCGQKRTLCSTRSLLEGALWTFRRRMTAMRGGLRSDRRYQVTVTIPTNATHQSSFLLHALTTY